MLLLQLALGSSASAIAFGSLLFEIKSLASVESMTTKSGGSAVFIFCGVSNSENPFVFPSRLILALSPAIAMEWIGGRM